ncbi:hypothetical protein AGMMS50212_02970 [Spirochaetia bacterium]|nr:hypothetical protein AGMMS50212_02970 [Spirochaetia bacterium]
MSDISFRSMYLHDVANILQIDFTGTDKKIDGLNLGNRETKYDSIISYITSLDFLKYLNNNRIRAIFLTKNGCDVVSKEYQNLSFFVVDYPEEGFYKLHSYLFNETIFYGDRFFKPKTGNGCNIHKSA